MNTQIVPISTGCARPSIEDRVRLNQQAVVAVKHLVERNYMSKIQGRSYLMVSGAQAIGSTLGYTTAIRSLDYVPPAGNVAGYWKAVAVVLDDGAEVGQGIGCVFDDERPWNTRPQFARQMMAQTRATGRALKGVMGWAFAMLGAEGSLAEEMPAEDATMPQEAPAPTRALSAPPKAAKPSKGNDGPLRRVRGRCAGVQPKESKAGKPYWRVGLELGDATEWFTSFDEVNAPAGVEVEVVLKPYRDGEIVSDVIVVPVGEEVPF